MHAPIKAMMNELVQNPPATGPCEVTALSQRRWMIESDTGPIVQLELLDDDVTALVYATTARDGSGPLRASFLTMLMLEDAVANSMHPHGVCSEKRRLRSTARWRFTTPLRRRSIMR